MQLSRFFKSIEITNDVYAIFNSLMMDIFFVNKSELSDIISLKSNDEKLIKAGIYVRDKIQDEQAINLIKNYYKQQNKKIGLMYFILSTGCNLACKYCFVENNSNNNHCEINMKKETAILALDKYMNYLNKNPDIKDPQVIFYGGEPFVNYDVLKAVVNHAKSKNSKLTFSLVTNATLLNDEIINFLKTNNISIGISIDGPKRINDKNRIFKNSDESVFDATIAAINKAKSYGLSYCLSITISKDLLDHQNEFFDWIKELNPPSIFYNLYHFSEAEKDLNCEDFYKKMDEFLFKSYDMLEPLGILDGRMARKIDSILNKEFKFADCASIGANQLTLKPDGEITLCHGFCKTSRNILGNINDNSIDELVNNKNAEFWTKLSPVCREECIDCEALYLCGGGCAVQAENLFGNINCIDKCFCVHSKDSLNWLLKKIYKITDENTNAIKEDSKK